jgi:hypothetical protein
MNSKRKIAVLGACIVSLFVLELQIVPEANAIFGTRRRTAMMTAAVVSSQDASKDSQSKQQASTSQSQAATPAATTTPPAPSTGALPLGTVVNALPSGCTSKPVDGVEYYHCGSNYYRAAFQGSSVVYITAQP